jgi:hypothetical protein
MTERNQRQDGMNNRNPNNDALDRELDATLAKYAAEPRTGLEERVLANLRAADQSHAAEHSWWRWPAVAAPAVLIVLALSVAWRSPKPAQNITMQHPPASMYVDKHIGTQVANNSGPSSIRPHAAGSGRQLRLRVISNPRTAVAPAPKLEQFPSPQPLSEQEKMLADYVAGHHQQAILVARARMAELKEYWTEEMQATATSSSRETSDQSVSQQEDR